MEAPNDPILWITLTVMLIGLVGSALPGLPGVPLIFISALVYAVVTDFEVVGGLTIALLGVFAAIALVLDFGATAYGARRFGASNWGTSASCSAPSGASSSASTSSAGNEKPPITANSPGCGRRGARAETGEGRPAQRAESWWATWPPQSWRASSAS
jgi:hypothetical protein